MRNTILESARKSMSVYDLIKPEKNPLPVIFDSPHSGRDYPKDFDFICDQDAMERAEDNDIDRIFENAPKHGVTFLHAKFPRTYLDLNRCAFDIDPDILDDEWPDKIKPTARSHAGIGLIRRLLRPGMPLYDRKLTIDEVKNRIATYYDPYHAALEKEIGRYHYNYGQVWHVNCHSFPSAKAAKKTQRTSFGILSMQPDFVLGDRDGTSCHADFTRSVRSFLKELGYRVAINDIYRGVEIVKRYGSPATGKHSLQIEINKGLYWDEAKIKPNKNYDKLKSDMEALTAHIASYAEGHLTAIAAD